MKKILLIITFSLFFSQNSFGVSKEVEKMLFTGCYQEASQKNNVEISSNYCNCYSSYISERYSDTALETAMDKPDVYEAVAKPAMTYCLIKFPIK